jgi:hemoglobin/transferrin/lactoferrin receptor protein
MATRTFLISLFISTVLFSQAVLSQSAGDAILITVKDSSGAPIAGAKVEVTVGGIAIRSVNTDADGSARIEGLKDGSYKAAVSASGFATVVRDVERGGQPSQPIDVVLGVGGVNEVVTVTATRTQVTASDTAVPVSVIGREEIEQKAVNSIGDIFRSLPGTSTVNEGGFQVRPRIRGLDSNRVLILVDGERLNNSRTSTGQSGVEIGLVDVSQIESVEVVRGSGSVLYGTDALGGTINIITRDVPARRTDGFRFGARLDTLFSSNERGRRGNLSVNGAGKHFAFSVSQSLERFGNYRTGEPKGTFLTDLRDDGFEGITDDGEVLNSQSHGSNTTAGVRFFLNDTNTIKAGYERRRASDIGSAGLVGTFNGFFPFSNRDKVSARFDSVGLNQYFQRLSVSGFYQTQLRNFTNILTVGPVPPFFPGLYQFSETVTDTETTGFDLQTDWKIGDRHYITAGGSFFRDENSDGRQILTGTRPTSPLTSNTGRSVPDASLSNAAAFVQDEFRVTRRFKLTGGVRLDNFWTRSQPTTGFGLSNLRPDQIADLGIGDFATGLSVTSTALTGDVGAVLNVTDNLTLSSRIGRSFRTPNIFELFFTDSGSVGGYVVGNPNLKPESGINFDSSVKVRLKRFSASATYFTNNYKNFLATAPAEDSRGCPVFIVPAGTVYDANNCFIVSTPPRTSRIEVFQTQNIDRARIQGFEAEFDAPIMISMGYLTPYGNFSYLRGDNTDTDEPLNFISPIRVNAGIRWQNVGKQYFADYNTRIVTTQDRFAASYLLPVNQGGQGNSPEPGFVTHNVSGGYYFRRERFNFNINLGVSNIFNRAYREQFVFAPARGRSFTIGTSWEIK